MVALKDPILKGIGFSFCLLSVVFCCFPLLVGTGRSVGNLWERSTDLQKPQQKMVEAAGIEPAS
jgi:hypothetical protein